MCKSGQFYTNWMWVIPLTSVGIDLTMDASMWKIKMCPHDIILMEDISNVFFDVHDDMNDKHEVF
jgi:hypothetical protein